MAKVFDMGANLRTYTLNAAPEPLSPGIDPDAARRWFDERLAAIFRENNERIMSSLGIPPVLVRHRPDPHALPAALEAALQRHTALWASAFADRRGLIRVATPDSPAQPRHQNFCQGCDLFVTPRRDSGPLVTLDPNRFRWLVSVPLSPRVEPPPGTFFDLIVFIGRCARCRFAFWAANWGTPAAVQDPDRHSAAITDPAELMRWEALADAIAMHEAVRLDGLQTGWETAGAECRCEIPAWDVTEVPALVPLRRQSIDPDGRPVVYFRGECPRCRVIYWG